MVFTIEVWNDQRKGAARWTQQPISDTKMGVQFDIDLFSTAKARALWLLEEGWPDVRIKDDGITVRRTKWTEDAQ